MLALSPSVKYTVTANVVLNNLALVIVEVMTNYQMLNNVSPIVATTATIHVDTVATFPLCTTREHPL
jgi:hypothetical protein